MTRGQSASWLPPLGINNTAIWVSPHTPVLSGSVPQQRLKHWGRGGGQETGGFEKRGSFEGKTVLQHISNRRHHTWDALCYSHVDQNSSTLEWHISFCGKKTCLFQGMLMSDIWKNPSYKSILGKGVGSGFSGTFPCTTQAAYELIHGLMVIHVKRSNLFPLQLAPSVVWLSVCVQNLWQEFLTSLSAPLHTPLCCSPIQSPEYSHSAKNKTDRQTSSGDEKRVKIDGTWIPA